MTSRINVTACMYDPSDASPFNLFAMEFPVKLEREMVSYSQSLTLDQWKRFSGRLIKKVGPEYAHC